MSKAHPPELKKFMDKRVHLRINGGREVSVLLQMQWLFIIRSFNDQNFQVEGTLCGFDPFMNLVLDDSIEFTKQVFHPI